MMTSVLLMSSCITAKRLVPVTHAFASEVQFGTVQQESGDKGNVKRDTVLIIYAETTRDSIQWGNIFFQNMEYKVIAQRINGDRFEAGFLPGNGNAQMIEAVRGRMLYQLQLQPTGKILSQDQQELNSNKAIIHFSYKNRNFKTITDEPVFLLQRPPA
jgi:hypothetical protein